MKEIEKQKALLEIQRTAMEISDYALNEAFKKAVRNKEAKKVRAYAIADAIISTTKSFVKYLRSRPIKKNRGAVRKIRALGYCSKNTQKHEVRKLKFNKKLNHE